MQRWITSALVLILASAAAPAGGEREKASENPYRSAKIGDFAAYTLITSVNGNEVDGSMKLTVIAKGEATVKIRQKVAFIGYEIPNQESTIDFTRPFDVQSVIHLGTQGAKFVKSGEGTSRITIRGREYNATWITGKATAQNGNIVVEDEVKVWFSKSVPLSGLLRMETKRRAASVVLELLEYGNAR